MCYMLFGENCIFIVTGFHHDFFIFLDAKGVLAAAGGVTGVSTSMSAHTNTPAAKESPSTTKM